MFLAVDVVFPTGSIPKELGRLTALSELDLDSNQLIGEAVIVDVVDMFGASHRDRAPVACSTFLIRDTFSPPHGSHLVAVSCSSLLCWDRLAPAM